MRGREHDVPLPTILGTGHQSKLSSREFVELERWLAAERNRKWDRQMETGLPRLARLTSVAEGEVEEDVAQGRTRPTDELLRCLLEFRHQPFTPFLPLETRASRPQSIPTSGGRTLGIHRFTTLKKTVAVKFEVRESDDNYRVLAHVIGDNAYWFWIGPHDQYETLIHQYRKG